MKNFADSLNQKRRRLATAQSTVPAAAGVQSAHSRAFQVDTPQPLAAYPAAGAAPIVILSYRVPAKMSGALRELAIVHNGAAGTFGDGSGNVVWRVLINGVPQKGLEAIYAQIGSILQPAQMFLLLKENDLLQITAQVPAGKIAPAAGTYPFARIGGYLDFGGLGSRVPAAGRAPARPVAAGTTQTSSTSSTSGGTVNRWSNITWPS